jgi:outer membrane receptor protein involved in Fe transport
MRFNRPAAALLGVSFLALAAPALAQDQAAAADGAVLEEAETIVVTGSRLARDPNAVAPVPISTLSAADFRAAGNTDTTATLRQLPALLSSGTIADSLERGDGGVGQATLDLRNLGSERTLVLVDGRRHVSGVGGSQAVDVATIPPALIERVEVLTGGASAIYGADAVTGVVNYVLKKDFEGFDIQAQTGISSAGDGTTIALSATYGKNFADGRGNITLSAGYNNDGEVLLGDRPFTANNGRANNALIYANPARRFQRGDINAATMPNFASFFSIPNNRLPFGFQIPTDAAEISAIAPGGLTPAERALVDRARGSSRLSIGQDPRFAISANNSLIFRADNAFEYDPDSGIAANSGLDINGNGIDDCRESYVGLTGFGGGGCYVTNPDGTVRVFNDGIISTSQNQFGGDGAVERTSETSLIPRSERFFAVLAGSFEFSPALNLFWDAKYARTKTTSRNSYNTFFDTAYISPDNPFIPAVLQPIADEAGGLLVSRDNTDFGPGITTSGRDTYRLVTGIEGEFSPNLRYDFAVNYGRTDIANTFSNTVLADRFLAATDAVRAPDGSIVCRSNLDPTATPPEPFLPELETGFFTFRPGDGQCRPVNLFRGAASASAESVAFFTRPSTDRQRLEQFVATLSLAGDSGKYFELPGGPIQFAVGSEYRWEKSRTTLSNEELGILDDGSFIGDVSSNVNLVLNDQVRTFNSGGSFDVIEAFGEIRLPILNDRPFFEELSVEAAGRYAHYSTIGGAFTWNLAGTWAPIRDIRFRGSFSRAIRAPNVSELFDPAIAGTFRPADPCNISDLNERIADGAPNAQLRKDNCAAALTALGVNPATYEDPLTARFPGTNSGNPDLQEERARTWTAGVLLQPRFIPGLSLSADYYAIEINDAIGQIDAQVIVNNCYDLPSFPDNQYCGFITRREDGGFSFLSRTQLNFSSIETSGVDMTAAYNFEIGGHSFGARVNANWIEKLNRFFDPENPDFVNPGLSELGVPEWSGVGSLTWTSPGGFSTTWRTQYVGKQAIASAIEIETIESDFGDAGFSRPYWIHDVSVNFAWNEGFEIFGGVNNLTNARPFIASSAYPVSGLGRFYFLGMRGRF